MNPMFLMQIKNQLETFNSRHPKLRLFFKDVLAGADSGDVLEISITKADGTKKRTNIRVAPEDKELFEGLISSLGGKL